jgi:hypothetical protein
MGRIRKRIPGPALTVAIVALVVALGGSAYGAKLLGVGALSEGAKNKTVGVGKLHYARTFTSVPVTNSIPNGFDVFAFCPAGTFVIGGGIRLGNDSIQLVNDSHPITNGWTGTVYNSGSIPHGATTTAICAPSRQVNGVP